jgi:hypothetical protein
VPTDLGFSTQHILETELSLIQTVNAGHGAVAPLCPEYQPAAWLGEDQRRAVLHVLNSGDRITRLRGLAGTGKTTALRELSNACEAAGVEPLFCAPTAAATDVLRKEGFDAVTLQSLLLSKHSLSNWNLVVLDEAGAVGKHLRYRVTETNHRRTSGFQPGIGDRLVFPVNVLATQ